MELHNQPRSVQVHDLQHRIVVITQAQCACLRAATGLFHCESSSTEEIDWLLCSRQHSANPVKKEHATHQVFSNRERTAVRTELEDRRVFNRESTAGIAGISYIITTLGSHRGAPRLWLQGPMHARAGFVPGARYQVDMGSRHITLRLRREGTRTVSRRARRERMDPVIDVNSRDDLRPFVGMARLRVIVRTGEILVTPLESELRIMERENRLLAAAAERQLVTGAIAFGGGVLDHIMHTTMSSMGIRTRTAFVNEIREDLVSHAVTANPVVDDDTILIIAPIQEAAFDERLMRQLPHVDLLVAALPCSGASLAGRAKRHLGQPEDHPEVGHLVAAAIAVIARTCPSCCVLENVPSYGRSASASMLRSQLRDLGYIIHETELNATDFGDLEARRRWCMVAVSRGMKLELEDLHKDAPVLAGSRTLGDILEHHDAPGIAERWSTMAGLRAKEERDAAAGNGFRMQVYTEESNSIGTLTTGMSKVRSTDPKIQHPHHPELLRVPTAREHARAKGVDPALVAGLSHTIAHELLGQSVCAGPFRAVFTRIAAAILAFRGPTEQPGSVVTKKTGVSA